jgi:leader peptidase (prepilin peptidase)/N-methyltransferase
MILGHSLFLFDAMLGLPQPLACAFIAVFGAIIGSFLNVVIHRLPREESIVFPNSRCPACAAAIHPLDNIPVLSYLILGGRCRACRAPISARYPMVEALTALLYALVFLRDGLTPVLPFDLAFVTALIALIFIDAEHQLLPDAITKPGMIFAIIARLMIPYLMGRPYFDDLERLLNGILAGWPVWSASLLGAILGALVGGGFLWLTGWVWERWRGVEAMGLGDVKMMFMVGAYLGWRLTTLTIFLAVSLAAFTGVTVILWQTLRQVGSIVGLLKMIFRGDVNLQVPLALGVFLGISTIIALLVGERIVNWYAGLFIIQ